MSILCKYYSLILFGLVCVVIYLLVFYIFMNSVGVVIGIVVLIVSVFLFIVLLEYLIEKKFIVICWLVSFCFGVIGIGLIVLGKEYNFVVKGLFS